MLGWLGLYALHRFSHRSGFFRFTFQRFVMNFSIASKIIAVSALCVSALPVFSQVSPANKPASTGSDFVAERAASSQPVHVRNAWVRATVVGQQGTGAFMTVTAKTATRLVAVASAMAGVAEVHEMKMDGDVMKMRAVPVLDLPAGQAVQFKPGGYHVMLMDLKQPLAKGSTVPLTLFFKDAKGVESRMDLKLPVAATPPAAGQGSGKADEMDHSAHHN